MCSGFPEFAAYFRHRLSEVRGKTASSQPDHTFKQLWPAVLMTKNRSWSTGLDFPPHFWKCRSKQVFRITGSATGRSHSALSSCSRRAQRYRRTIFSRLSEVETWLLHRMISAESQRENLPPGTYHDEEPTRVKDLNNQYRGTDLHRYPYLMTNIYPPLQSRETNDHRNQTSPNTAGYPSWTKHKDHGLGN